jgi:hypothetical protein
MSNFKVVLCAHISFVDYHRYFWLFTDSCLNHLYTWNDVKCRSKTVVSKGEICRKHEKHEYSYRTPASAPSEPTPAPPDARCKIMWTCGSFIILACVYTEILRLQLTLPGARIFKLAVRTNTARLSTPCDFRLWISSQPGIRSTWGLNSIDIWTYWAIICVYILRCRSQHNFTATANLNFAPNVRTFGHQ